MNNPLTQQEKEVQKELMQVELVTIHAETSEFKRRRHIKVYSSEDVKEKVIQETIN
tara:strand:+ start:300 stop:467 length:168 start_codon:yes stop_codon:yes gene_type:complete